jgi:hypothetical protein
VGCVTDASEDDADTMVPWNVGNTANSQCQYPKALSTLKVYVSLWNLKISY